MNKYIFFLCSIIILLKGVLFAQNTSDTIIHSIGKLTLAEIENVNKTKQLLVGKIVSDNEDEVGPNNGDSRSNNSYTFTSTNGPWFITDQGYISLYFPNNNFAPSGAIVTNIEYNLKIDDTGDPDNFYCGDYEIYISSSNSPGVNQDIKVYDNLGGSTDEGYDDDGSDDSDIYLNWRSSTYFNGESANQYWGIKVKDTYSGDDGELEYIDIRVTWTGGDLDVDPDVEYVKINTTNVYSGNTYMLYLNSLSETFELEIRGENDGDDECPDDMSYLSTSFEQFTSDNDKNRISVGSHSSDLDIVDAFGNEAGGGDEYADYVMVEGIDENGWKDNESNYYKLDISPKNWGDFIFHYKLVMAENEAGSSYARDPNSGDPDPIGEPSYTVTLNIQQTPGTIKVYVKDQNGNNKQNAIVYRYDSNWQNRETKFTNTNGYVSWNDCIPDYEYNFEAWWDSPVYSDDEYWAGASDIDVSSGSTETITLQRNMPYTLNYQLFDDDGNQNTNFYLGETITIRWNINNDYPWEDFGVKVRCQADRSKTGSMDYDVTPSYWTTIDATTCGWIDFDFTPSDLGNYYIRPYLTRSLTWGNDNVTDTWDWASSPAFNIQPLSGDLDINVNNVPIGSSNYPGNDGTVKLYSSNGSLYATDQTNNNFSEFNNVPTASGYYYKVYHDPGTTPFPEEYWGMKESVNINTGQTTNSSFTRDMPHGMWDESGSPNVNIQIIDLNTNQFVTWGNVYTGTPLKINFTVTNPNSATQSAKTHFILKKGSVTVVDETSAFKSISSSGTKQYSFYYTPTEPGSYYHALGTITNLSGPDPYTDTWPISNVPFFTVTIPTGNLIVDVSNVPAGSSSLPGDNGKVDFYTNGSNPYASVFTQNNVATINDIPTGNSYYYTVKHDPALVGDPTIFGEEYWGIEENITIALNQNSTSYFTRHMPYGDEIKLIAEGYDVTWGTITAGTQVSVECTVFNPDVVSHSVKARVVLDRDEQANPNYDFDQTSSSYTIGPGQSHTFTLSFLPTYTGNYYRQIGTLTLVDGNYITTDGWPWFSSPAVTVEPSLIVNVQNIDNTSIPFPGDNGTVDLIPYGSNTPQYFSGTLQGEAEFESVSSGSYYYKVHHDPTNSQYATIFGEEYWGKSNGFILNYLPPSSQSEFLRHMPYNNENVKIFNGTDDVTNGEVQVGTELLLRTVIKNPDPNNDHLVKSRVVLDLDGNSSYDFDAITNSYSINSGSTNSFYQSWTPLISGNYSSAISVESFDDGNYKNTDGWAWESIISIHDPLGISITEPSTIVSHSQGDLIDIQWIATGPSTTTVDLFYDLDDIWGNGNETPIQNAQGLNMIGSFNWNTSNVPIGSYYIVGKAMSNSQFQIGYSLNIIDIAGDYSIELMLYKVSNITGIANSPDPGDETYSFEPGETVRITMKAENTLSSIDVQCVLNIFKSDGVVVYDSHVQGENNSTDTPLTQGETDYYSFDWVIPDNFTNFGNFSIGSSIRSLNFFDIIYETTCEGPNSGFNCNWVEPDVFAINDEIISIEITSGPDGTINYNDIIFSWLGNTSNGYIVNYEYNIDNVNHNTTDIMVHFEDQSFGQHVFEVRCKNSNGEYSEWEVKTYFIDNVQSTTSPPYPIIFVHGWNGNQTSFNGWIDLINNNSFGWEDGGQINVCTDAVNSTLMDDATSDVQLITQTISSADYYRINFDINNEGITNVDNIFKIENISDIDNEINISNSNNGNLLHLNTGDIIIVDDEYMRIISRTNNVILVDRPLFGSSKVNHNGTWFRKLRMRNISNLSDQSSIVKTGIGLKKAIDLVKATTGYEKVILVAHSMGGLTSREYVQSDYYESDVAAIATYSTPHMGSNTSDITNIGQLLDIDYATRSDAVRDLRYSVELDLFPPENDNNAPYLYGGFEDDPNWDPSFKFFSHDVNADGDNVDYINEGLNDKLWPIDLPLNTVYADHYKRIKIGSIYIWVSLGTDDIVSVHRQYPETSIVPSNIHENYGFKFYGYFNNGNPLIPPIHNHTHKRFPQVMIALDEPDFDYLAYELLENISYTGFVTDQENGSTDIDWYYFQSDLIGDVSLSINTPSSLSFWQLELYDGDENGKVGTSIETINNFNNLNTINFSIVPDSYYYFKITAEANNDTYTNPYLIEINTVFNPETQIVYNTQLGPWRNSNQELDIDVVDNPGISSIKYMIPTISNNWNNLTVNGISEITSFNSAEFTDNWMISQSDWDALPLNNQTQGWHYIYFKVEDVNGNIYITSSQEDAFKLGKDENAPTCYFAYPEENQVISETDVSVAWYVSDILTGLPMSGVDSIYFKIDIENEYTVVGPNVYSHDYTNLSVGPHTVYLYAIDSADNQHSIDLLNFEINTSITPPDPFDLTLPFNNDIIYTQTPLFQWEITTDPDGGAIEYELWYDYSPTFDNKVVVPNLINNFHNSSTLNDNSTVYWKVKSIDDEGSIRWCNQTDWSFFVNSQNDPPTNFNLNEVENEHVVGGFTPYFDWSNSIDNDPNDTISYILYVSQDSTFTPGTFMSYMVDNSEHAINDTLESNLKHYWKVQALDNQGAQTWSDETDWWFETPNNTPVLNWTSQSNFEGDGVHPNIANDTTNFEFRISYFDEDNTAPISGYPKLHIFLNGSEIINSPFTMDEFNTNPYNIGRIYCKSINNLVSGGQYSYSFEAYDEHNGQATGDGVINNFGPIVNGINLTNPIGGEHLYSNQVYDISWNIDGLFDSLNLAYSANNGNSWNTIATGISSSSSIYSWVVPYDISDSCLVSVVGYYNNGILISQSDSVFSIFEPVDPPNSFSLLSPYNIELTDLTPTFYWNTTVDPDSTEIYYDLWYSLTDDFVNSIIIDSIITPPYTAISPLEDNSKVYWKVRASDSLGQSTWSTEQDWFFYINVINNAPNTFLLTLPSNGALTSSTKPLFEWTGSIDIDPLDTVSYALLVSQDNLFNDTSIYIENIDSTAIIITNELEFDTYYYWKVKVVDNHGDENWCVQTNWWFLTPVCKQIEAPYINEDQTICYNEIPNLLSTTSLPQGGNGDYTYQWMISTNNIDWDSIIGATDTVYQPGYLQQTTYYKIQVFSDGSCAPVSSDEITVIVKPQLTSGTIFQDQIICFNTIPNPLSFQNSPYGGNGNYTYQWKQKYENSTVWSEIPFATEQSYTPGQLTLTTLFMVEINDDCGTVLSNIITVNVLDILTQSTIGNNQDVCFNGTPELITTIANTTGGEGNYGYQWYNATVPNSWQEIIGATQENYQSGLLTDTTFFRCDVIDYCGTVESNIVTIGTYDEFISGAIGQDQTICFNGQPDTIRSINQPSGGLGNHSYQWQVLNDLGNWSDINLAESLHYLPGLLTETIYYRLESHDYCDTVISNVIEITVYDEFLPGTVGDDQFICAGDIPTTLSVLNMPTGGGLIYNYQWQQKVGNSSYWDPIMGATALNYQPNPLVETTTFRIQTISVMGCDTVNSNETTITVMPQPVSMAGLDDTICEDAVYQLSGYAENHTSVLWANVIGNGTFSDLTILNPIYTPHYTDLLVGHVRLSLTVYPTPPCTEPDFDVIMIFFEELPTANAGSDGMICENGAFAITNASGTNYKSILWQGGDGSFDDPTLLLPIYTPGFNDIYNGGVQLKINAVPNDPCIEIASDTLYLSIQVLPTVNSGNDTTICESECLQLNGLIENYTSFEWFSNGDGIFLNDDDLDARYCPSDSDIIAGNVLITLTATGIEPCSDNVSDSFNLSFTQLPIADAGNDSVICASDLSIQVLDASASNYNSIYWQTNGDGNFVDSTIINATYQLGQQDIQNGFVDLILTAEPNSPCLESFSDVKIIDIVPVSTSDAGEDGEICESETIYLNGEATNMSGVLWTNISGDGIFSCDTCLNTYFEPGIIDIQNQSAIVTLTTFPLSPCVDPNIDTVIISIQSNPIAYAGSDGVVCEDESYSLFGSASNYSSLYWNSTGDGTFNNRYILNPIYTPGPNDIISGYVDLLFFAFSINPCNIEASDTLGLSVIKNPTINAGIDFEVCEGDSCLLDPTVNNYDGVTWKTTGDGIFSDSTILNTIYFPGNNDIANGMVDLIVTAYANAPCLVNDSDSISIGINYYPAQPFTPNGPTEVDLEITNLTEYLTFQTSNTTSYLWGIFPSGAGIMDSYDTLGIANWSQNYPKEDSAWLFVQAINGLCNSNSSDSLIVTFLITRSDFVGANSIITSLFPNPSTGIITLRMLGITEKIEVAIYNFDGQLISNETYSPISTKIEEEINLSNEPNGVYLFKIKHSNGIIRQKVIKGNRD